MKREHYIIDRFEDNAWAVLEREDGETFNIPQSWLPPEADEGDVVKLKLTKEDKESTLYFSVDSEATQARRTEAKALRARLVKGPEGDLEL